MLDIRNALEVRHSDSGTFTDFKFEAQDFTRDTFALALTVNLDYLYVGFYKPISCIYIDAPTPNTVAGYLTAEYFNGTAFVALEGYVDETKNLSRNGFISWSRNQNSENYTTIDGLQAYWYKFKSSTTTSDITMNALNLIFSDDQALKVKFNKILSEEFLDGELTHNRVHVACRDEIVEDFRRKGYKKYNTQGSDTAITPWDLHDIFEIKEASSFLALSKIFFDFSDKPDDIWMVKSKYYTALYEECLELASVSIDVNDDGIEEEAEKLAESRTKYITR